MLLGIKQRLGLGFFCILQKIHVSDFLDSFAFSCIQCGIAFTGYSKTPAVIGLHQIKSSIIAASRYGTHSKLAEKLKALSILSILYFLFKCRMHRMKANSEHTAHCYSSSPCLIVTLHISLLIV